MSDERESKHDVMVKYEAKLEELRTQLAAERSKTEWSTYAEDKKTIQQLRTQLAAAQEQIRITYGDLQHYVSRSDELTRKLAAAQELLRKCDYNGVQYAWNEVLLQRDEASHQLAAAQALMKEIRQAHADPDDPNYNQCDKEGEECRWCEDSKTLTGGTAALDAAIATAKEDVWAKMVKQREAAIAAATKQLVDALNYYAQDGGQGSIHEKARQVLIDLGYWPKRKEKKVK